MVARLALDELGERARVLGDTGRGGQDAGGDGGEDEEGSLHFRDQEGGYDSKSEERLKLKRGQS